MLKIFILPLFVLMFSLSAFSNENSLTIKQQIERLQREVSDISKRVFQDKNNNSNNVSDEVMANNLSSFDMRLYDIEKDIKNLNSNIEEIYFEFEEIINQISLLNEIITEIDSSINSFDSNIITPSSDVENEEIESSENTLGQLKIETAKDVNENSENIDMKLNSSKENILSTEEEFQIAFDALREKNYKKAKLLFSNFIKDNPENQLSGSAYYWLGELFILEKNFRESALTLAEGYQKFPNSIKAADMLFKLSTSLSEINKLSESCSTLKKLQEDFPNNMLSNKAKSVYEKNECNVLLQ